MEQPPSHPSIMPPPPPPATDPMQFDKVEYADATATAAICVACNTPITDSYFEVNGKLVCPNCKDQLQGSIGSGSKILRMVKAFGLGLVATVVSAAGYFLIAKITQMELAIATIAMGWLIGKAVHMGANGRGGWFYIGAAVLLTYLAISSSLLALGLSHMDRGAPTEQVESGSTIPEEQAQTSQDPVAPATADISTKGADQAAKETAEDAAVAVGAVDADLGEPGIAEYLIGLVLMLGFMLSFPVIAAMESPLLFLIYGFGLWQAARMNLRPHISVTGPYYTRQGSPSTASTGGIPDNQVI